MTLTADQYFQISQGYAKAAADPFVPPEKREAFANKAEWFDFLGRREGGVLRSDGNAATGNSDLIPRTFTGELDSSERPRGSMRPLVMTLWLTGAAFCLIGMLLFTNALNQFGDNDRQEVASLSVVPAPKVASVEAEATEQGERQFQPTADRAHQEELSSPSPPPEPIEELVAAPPPEVLKVTANARIRNGPSTSGEDRDRYPRHRNPGQGA